MMRLLFLLLLLLPERMWGHGAEFLGAKLQVLPSRELVLEVTADYGENPMIADRAEAEAVLKDLLLVEQGGQKTVLRDLAPMQIQERTLPDADSPLPTDLSGKEHLLLTALWRWTPPEGVETVRFHVPEAVIHSTVFWLEERGVVKEKKKWSMLLGGDSTPAVPVPKRAVSFYVPVFVVIIGLAVAFFLLHRLRSSPA